MVLLPAVFVLALGVSVGTPAQALSCLSIDEYLKMVTGDEGTLIFTAEVVEQMDEADYTAEVLNVTEVHQGYVEDNIFVYHEKNETWGYLCNIGPQENIGDTGVYVASRDTIGKYNVTQRLDVDDILVTNLKADLAEAEITGEVVELSVTDRLNQIMTTISDMLREITLLFKEYQYWK